jgi:hypothetical protein
MVRGGLRASGNQRVKGHSNEALAGIPTLLVSALVVGLGASAPLQSAYGQASDSAAAELSDPNTTIGLLNIYFDYVSFGGTRRGAGEQNGSGLLFQPFVPIPLGEGVNVLVRPAFPVIFNGSAPLPVGGFEDLGFNLGEIGLDVEIGKSFKSGFGFSVGTAVTFPTATNDAIGQGQLALGPEVFVWVRKKWGVVGALVSRQWGVAGGDPGDPKANVTGGQYYYTFNLKHGWQIQSTPVFSYDHNAAAGQGWTFPLGFGITKTTILEKSIVQFSIEYWHFVAQPDDFGPDWQLRFTITPVVPLPW